MLSIGNLQNLSSLSGYTVVSDLFRIFTHVIFPVLFALHLHGSRGFECAASRSFDVYNRLAGVSRTAGEQIQCRKFSADYTAIKGLTGLVLPGNSTILVIEGRVIIRRQGGTV